MKQVKNIGEMDKIATQLKPIIDDYEKMDNNDKYIANASSRDQSVICPHIQINYQE